ncbi:hypothetical protein [Trinickia violacea]|uniref:hypothetical protein n=1 Tax=Trinickia violacea TaxID=2571746 RepID=UPI003F5CED08
MSGYLDPIDVSDMASHAWVDVWIDNGWVTVDVTYACFVSEKYCWIAMGRDYESAVPVRGPRVGGMSETMSVSVQVNTQESQQQVSRYSNDNGDAFPMRNGGARQQQDKGNA